MPTLACPQIVMLSPPPPPICTCAAAYDLAFTMDTVSMATYTTNLTSPLTALTASFRLYVDGNVSQDTSILAAYVVDAESPRDIVSRILSVEILEDRSLDVNVMG